ncbi:MAG: hypothetical protein H7X76_01080 [Prolixibacteraceae bacterium]|nr:hypothetical protein [Burkholderiales bacterium]
MKRYLIVLLALACADAAAQSSPPVRLRATVESYEAPNLVIKERSGDVISLTLPEETGVVEVIPTDITSIQPGSFIGTAALPRIDGKLDALEVVVFPEAARGTGEGHYLWDLKPGSTMTNATVTDLVRSPKGRTLTLRYKDGEKTVVVPEGVPVVTFKPGDHSLIVPGAKVFIVADVNENQLTVRRLLVGRNGLAPPM